MSQTHVTSRFCWTLDPYLAKPAPVHMGMGVGSPQEYPWQSLNLDGGSIQICLFPLPDLLVSHRTSHLTLHCVCQFMPYLLSFRSLLPIMIPNPHFVSIGARTRIMLCSAVAHSPVVFCNGGGPMNSGEDMELASTNFLIDFLQPLCLLLNPSCTVQSSILSIEMLSAQIVVVLQFSPSLLTSKII